MFRAPYAPDRTDIYALVSYIPEPLAGFLDHLRQELVPNCFLRAHVTVLPPRKLTSDAEEAWRMLCEKSAEFQPFDVELAAVELFHISDVLYISVGEGAEQLREMNAAMNAGGLRFKEGYPYHPHVTLAQELRPDELDELARVARLRWKEFSCPRRFRVDTLTFVQNTCRKTWIDLAECKLGPGDGLNRRVLGDGELLRR